MNWFRNLKVAAKLYIGFLSILVLTTVIGAFAIYQLAQVNGSAVELGTNWMPSTNKIAEMDRYLSNFRRSELQHVISTDKAEMDRFEKRMEQTMEAYNKAEAVYAS